MTQDTTQGWMSRFGTLVDVTERQGPKGGYATFKLDAKTFVQYGACFNPEIITQMKAAVGQKVWMKGPVEVHQGRDAQGNPREMKSYKVIYFKTLAEDHSGLEAA